MRRTLDVIPSSIRLFCISMPWYKSSDLNYVLRWLIMFCVAEFPDTASITDLVENDTIKTLARSSIVFSACSSFAALSGNSDLHLHSTGRKTVVHLESEESSAGEGSEESEENEDESDSDEEEDDKGNREPIEHLLTVRKVTFIYFYLVAISGHVSTRILYYWGYCIVRACLRY